MKSPFFALIIYLIISLTACTLPEPVERATPSLPAVPTTVSPAPPITEEVASQPEETEAVIETVVASATVKTEKTPSPTHTAEPTAQPEIVYRYTVQIGTPVWTANFLQPEAGCDWMGVGGQVFSKSDNPVAGLIVEVGGTLNGSPVLLLSITGDSTALGSGGYEIKIADSPVASQGTLWLQLHDLMGNPQSEKVYFDTYSGEEACENNLMIMNFRELSTGLLEQYLPSIFRAP